MKYAILISLVVVVTGCDSADLPPTTFQSDASPAANMAADQPGERLLFQTPPTAEVNLPAEGQPSVLQLDEVDSFGTVSPNRDLVRRPNEAAGHSDLMTLIRPESASEASTGAPSALGNDGAQGLDDLILIDAEPGAISIETPGSIGTGNGR